MHSSLQSDFDVFLSHNSADKPIAFQLRGLLQSKGLKVWFDQDELRPGQNWQPLLREGLQKAGSVVVALGPSGLGPWQDEETQLALAAARTHQRPVIPVLLPGAPDGPEALGFLENRTWVDFRKGFAESLIANLVWGITGRKSSDESPVSLPPTLPATKWILVAGSGGVTPRPARIDEMSKALGVGLAKAGFSLVTGGWNGVDHDVARAFGEQLQRSGQALSARLVQVMKCGATPDFPAGRLVNKGTDEAAWQHSIERADAIVLLGGLGGTAQTGEWALQAEKPVFPIADSRGPAGSHGDAYDFYHASLRDWGRNPACERLSKEQFRALSSPSPGVVADLVRLLGLTLI